MPIDAVIREKRKEQGLTQEKVAEYLGVSTPAVNKWEKGISYPDISLLPPLARLLKIDLNALFCFQEELTEQEIENFSKEVTKEIEKRGLEKGFSMMEKKVQQYPNCGLLLHTCAMILDSAVMMAGLSGNERERLEERILHLYERAAGTNDSRISMYSTFMLASKYMNGGEYEKAQELLDRVPEKNVLDKGLMQANILIQQNKLKEAAKNLERALLLRINEIMSIVLNLSEIAIREGADETVAHLEKLWDRVTEEFELWNYHSGQVSLYVALMRKDIPRSLKLLRNMLEAVITPWEMDKTILYQHIASTEEQKDKMSFGGVKMLPALLAELESGSRYEFLRSNEEFRQLIKEYRRKAASLNLP